MVVVVVASASHLLGSLDHGGQAIHTQLLELIHSVHMGLRVVLLLLLLGHGNTRDTNSNLYQHSSG